MLQESGETLQLGLSKSQRNPYRNTTIEAGTRVSDSLMIYSNSFLSLSLSLSPISKLCNIAFVRELCAYSHSNNGVMYIAANGTIFINSFCRKERLMISVWIVDQVLQMLAIFITQIDKLCKQQQIYFKLLPAKRKLKEK